MPAPEADIFSPPTEANRISPSSSGAPLKVIFPLIGRRSECGPHPETKASKMSANADKAVKLEENWLGAESIERFSEMLLTHAIAAYRGGLPHFKRRRIYMSTFFSSFAKGFLAFSRGKTVSDDAQAPGIEIGRPQTTYRRIRIESTFGKLTVLVTDGQLPYPYGREITGYEVANLAATLSKGKSASVTVLVAPYQAEQRESAIVQFPGGYIAEIHSQVKK